MKTKRKRGMMPDKKVNDQEDAEVVPAARHSDQPAVKRGRWTNKQRVLVLSSRGISSRNRHLMEDLRQLLPHSKKEPKMERKGALSVLDEVCEVRNCNKCLFFECKKRDDLYLWISNVGEGPSAKFLVQNIHTMAELKLAGNCLKGSRPILSFDSAFHRLPHLAVLRELFVQTFGTPNHHPKSKPFVDHVLSFSLLDGRVWFRNYQILDEDGKLSEIGPRFVLNPIKIFSGSFSGAVLWENSSYVSPNSHRQQLKRESSRRYVVRAHEKIAREKRRPAVSYPLDPTAEVFRD